MKNVPHWQWLMVVYFVLVAVPVMIVHSLLKKRLLADKTCLNFIIYFTAVVGTAFFMHFLAMWLYFKFMFLYKD
jgi:predicted permease